MNDAQRIYEEGLKAKRDAAKRKGTLLYDAKYDAVYDKETNEWLETACDSADCEYCKDRPEKHIP